jgi:hypothetical protein
MGNIKFRSRGFTLIAALLLLLLMSGLAIGLLMTVNTESRVGGNDLEHNVAYHAAEGGIENMTSALANTFQNIQSPTVGQITALGLTPPTNDPTITYTDYSFTPVTNPDGTLWRFYGLISSGQNQGLYAQLIKVNLLATAQRPLGDQVSMTRQVEVALIPVFQFGIFSDADLSFFAGPNLDFKGRVHTNADLYLAEGSGGRLTFHDKVSAWGNVIRWELANGNTTAGTGHLGSVFLPTTALGCDPPQPRVPPVCRDMGADTTNGTDESSVTAGAAPNTWTTSGQNNPAWQGISKGQYAGQIMNGNYGLQFGTGANLLNLPFVNGAGAAAGGPQPYEIIRQPPAGEGATTPLGAARLYNEAQIRVLLADTPNDLPHPGFANGAADPNNIRLANGQFAAGPDYSKGIPTSFVKSAAMPALPGGADKYTTYFATASTLVPNPSALAAGPALSPLITDWLFQPLAPLGGDVTLFNANAPLVAQGVTGGQNVGLKVQPPTVNVTACDTTAGTCPAYPYYAPTANPSAPAANETIWNLLDGYIRVEYVNAGGATIPVTQEWLQLGFARDTFVPTAPGGQPGGNDVNPNAILILQEPADRNGNGVADPNGVPPTCTKKASGPGYNCTTATLPEVTIDGTTKSPWYGDSNNPNPASNYTSYNWYPINFYDAREGEARDVPTANDSCTPAGVMNAVELDVGNLQKWLNGTIAGSGNLVNFTQQNGYALYFSDRRGMLPNPNGTPVDPANTKTGDSGLEDVINTGNAVGTPDGVLQATPANKAQSPEDVNNNRTLDNFGAANLGLGLGYVGGAGNVYTTANNVNRVVMAGAVPNPYLTVAPGRIPACTIAQKNWVSGARHVLKLVDGSLGNLPVRLDNGAGGFTVGSENPVYIQGDYNSSAADPTWGNPLAAEPAHAAAGVIADAVTVLSNNWKDWVSLTSPSDDSNANAQPGRFATTTYYRVAVSAGKNINFPVNGIAWAVGDWGTDGGLHNFLRLLENWNGQTLNYKGSMVSMYYATYATGTDKNGGGTVYEPPTRNYIFDPLFTQPQNLPPATPMFRDIDNLSYTQIFTPRSN